MEKFAAAGNPRIPEIAEVDAIRRKEQLEKVLDRYDYSLDKIRTKGTAIDRRKELVDMLEKRGLNGNSKEMAEKLLRKGQEFDRKESFLGKAREKLKSAGKWSINTMKRHPYLTAAILIAILGAAAYYTGVGPAVLGKVKEWIASKMASGALGNATELAQGAAETAKDVAGTALDQLPTVPPTPTPAPLPTSLPGIDEAERVLRGLEGI